MLQQRLVDAQQSVDREYARMRNAETRNRLLFQLASEAVLILDASTLRVVEANPAATQLLGLNARKLAGRQFPEGLDEETTEAVATMLANVRASGRNGEVRARLADGSRELLVSASVFREERSTLLLVRATPMDADRLAEVAPGATARYVDFVAAAPDGFVVTDAEGKVLAANPAFLDLAQLPGEEQARGESLETWLGRPGVDLNVLLAQLREHGSVRLFATTLRGANGTTTEVELSGAALRDSEPACFGFTVRDVGSRLGAAQRTAPPLSRSVEQLTELVGRVPAEGHRPRDQRHHRAPVHRGCPRAHPGQPRFGRRDARPEPAEPLRETAPVRPGRPRRHRGRLLAATGSAAPGRPTVNLA